MKNKKLPHIKTVVRHISGRFDKKSLLIFLSFGLLVFLYLWTKPNLDYPGTVKIWDRNNILLYESAGAVGSRIPVVYKDISKSVIDAVVASEDETFWTNPGIDLQAMVRSLYINIKEGKVVSGASTITQQVARASYGASSPLLPVRIIRKIREVITALRISFFHSKEDILVYYLNRMYFGNLAYGIESAARTYFGKNAEAVSPAQAAFLAGLISSPGSRNPYVSFQLAKTRQEYVLDLMEESGMIDDQACKDAKMEKIVLKDKNIKRKAPHFTDYILNQAGSMGINPDRGINVYTTLDYPLFRLSEELARLQVNKLRNKHNLTNAALVLIRNDTGEVLSMLGGVDYFDATRSGQVNMATGLRQPGSALKPVTYAAAFTEGFTPSSLIYDVKKVYQTKKGEGFTPNNYDGRYHGMVLAREALASSFNLPAVEMLSRIGIDKFIDTSRKLGIRTFNQPDRYDLSITLGGGEVTLLDLTNVFASLARGGEFLNAYAIEKITADNGKVLYRHNKSDGKPVLGKESRQVAYLISDILSDPQARVAGFGQKNPLMLPFPAAVKTGTTTDWHDNWTVGYTPSYTVGVWTGNNDNQPMQDLSGVVGAAPIWNQFFSEFMKGKQTEKFIRPEGIVEVEVCALSGMLPDGLCPEIKYEKFIAGTEPEKISHFHKKVMVDMRNGLLAGNDCPVEFKEEKVFVDYPPETFSWAVDNNQEVAPHEYSPLCKGGALPEKNNLYLEITYPKNGTVFETAKKLVVNEGIVFEAAVSGDIIKVKWYINGKFYQETGKFPFSVSWKPTAGEFKLSAEGISIDGKTVKKDGIKFTVVEYKEGY